MSSASGPLKGTNQVPYVADHYQVSYAKRVSRGKEWNPLGVSISDERERKILEESLPKEADAVYTYENGKLWKKQGLEHTTVKVTKELSKVLDQTAKKASVAAGIKKSDIKFDLTVVPAAQDEILHAAAMHEAGFYYQIEELMNYTKNHFGAMKKKGYTDVEIGAFQNQLSELQARSKEMYYAMNLAQRHLSEWELDEAAEVYTRAIDEQYGYYAGALAEARTSLTLFHARMGEKAPTLEVDRFDFHEKLFSGTMASIEVEEETTTYLAKLNHFFKNEERTQAFAQECALNGELHAAYETVLAHSEEALLETYQAALESSDKMVQLYKRVDQHIAQGKIDEGVALYSAGMEAIYLPYIEQLKSLKVPLKKFHSASEASFPMPKLARAVHHASGFQNTLERARGMMTIEVEWENVLQAAERPVLLEQHQLSHAIDEKVAAERKFLDELRAITAPYSEHYELFEALMRKKGVSPVESAILFSSLEGAEVQIKTLLAELENVQKLADEEDYEGAIELFVHLSQAVYPEYCRSMLQGVRAQELLKQVDKRPGNPVKEALGEFWKRLDFPVPNELKDPGSFFAKFLARPLKFPLFINEDLSKSLVESQKEALLEAKKALNAENNKIDTATGAFKDLTRVDDSFVNSFGGAKAIEQDKAFYGALTSRGWTKKEINDFNKLGREFTKQFSLLYQGWQALEFEEAPDRRRAQGARLRKMAVEKYPALLKWSGHFKDFGGREKLLDLRDALHSYMEKGGHPESAEGPLEQVDLALARLELMNQIFDDLALKKNEPPRRWEAVYKEIPEMKPVGELYDAYFKAYEPVYLAKARLDLDPHNKKLQKELRTIYRAQEPKLSKISRSLNRLGGKKRLSELSFSIERLIADLEKHAVPNQRMIERLKRGNISADFLAMDEEVAYIEALCKNPMSGDKLSSPKEIGKLLDRYQKEFAPVLSAVRALEEEPGNAKLRDNLRKLLTPQRRARTEELNREYQRLLPSIQNLTESDIPEAFKSFQRLARQANEMASVSK